jgi:multiple sugar transport system ATP-binding protein
MATVTMDKVNKVYENGFHAVKDMDMEVADGEFMVLVGPSGCGKTTTLRMVAGLEDVTSGTLRIGGKVVNDGTPKERDIAMVFQNYALYPHMTVAENIGFALKLRHLPKDQIRAKVDEAAKILDLTEWLDRKPAQLSGGQRQRVAMGRAIVREPSVFLMDEPLSNLDAKLRVQMRAEVQRIQRRINVATIYVTHDQVEAMTMGDRVIVMRDGMLQQVDTPQNLYDNPDNVFVAAFIGSPAMNLYDAVLGADARSVKLGSQQVDLPDTVAIKRPALRSYIGKDVVVGMRPENLRAAPPDYTGPTLIGNVELVEALGSELVVHFTIDANRVLAEGAVDQDEAAAVKDGEGVARVVPGTRVKPGDKMPFAVDIEDMYFFDTETDLAIRDLARRRRNGMADNRWIRASDQDREDAAESLSEAYAVGRLSREELDNRATAAYSATTWGELRDLTTDLALAPRRTALPSAAVTSRRAPRRTQRGLSGQMTWIHALMLGACLCGMVAPLAPWVTVVLMAVALLLAAAIGTQPVP